MNDMENARFYLCSNIIGGPAEEWAVVEVRTRSVPYLAHSFTHHAISFVFYIIYFGGTVEGPPEQR